MMFSPYRDETNLEMAVPGTPPPSRTTSTSSSWLVKSILNWSLRLLGVFLTIYILILYFPTWRSPRALHQNGHSIQDSKSIENQIAHIEDIRNWQKPVDLQIIGLVFYGRREYVAVLDCYLKVRSAISSPRNLLLTQFF